MSDPRSIEARIRVLEDHHDIAALVARHQDVADQKDFDSWPDILTDDIVVEFPFASHTGRDGIAEWGRNALAIFEATFHMQSNLILEIDGDTARGRTTAWAVGIARAESRRRTFEEGGVYQWTFRRTSEGWRIAKLSFAATWATDMDNTGLAGN
ncbi:MAG TPA: nuclear transport factor 2 family protein [Pseudolysinimonas sp.]|nr:nuclear transport factor 2 family protein [Pseudolysinimonas sp.]